MVQRIFCPLLLGFDGGCGVCLMIVPGMPTTSENGGMMVFSFTSAPAPIMLPRPIFAPDSMMAPMPIKQHSSMWHPCKLAW